jgi:hypothetical protein
MGAANYNLISAEPGFAGQVVDARSAVVTSRTNGGAVAQVSTVTVDSASASTLYTLDVTINGVATSLSYTSDGTPTTTEIAAGLEAELDASPVVSGLIAASSSSNVLTLTAKIANQAFSLAMSAGASDITIATGTAASGAASIYPGRGVVELASDLGNCRLPSTADDALKVLTITFGGTWAAGDVYSVAISPGPGAEAVFDAFTVSLPAPSGTDLETTIAGLQIAINEVLDDIGIATATIAATDTATTLILTSELPNLDFRAVASVVGADGATSGATVAYADTVALVDLKFLGVAMLDRMRPMDSSGNPVFGDGDIVPILEEGMIYAVLDDGITPTIGDPVFCRASASGSEVLGAFRDSQDAADCFLIPPSRARWVDSSAYNLNGVRCARLQLFR